MKSTVNYRIVCAGLLGLVATTSPVFAQTTPLNMGGSSAGRNFATDVPLNLCDASPLPNHFVSANGNLHVWNCNRNRLPVSMRYSATGSSDGVNKLLVPTANPASNMAFLDESLTAGCTSVGVVTRPSDNKQYNETNSCNNTNTIQLPVHMGASDVGGSSFHQVGPIGTSINPLDDSTLNSVQATIVPFSIFLGKGVVKVDPTTGLPSGQVNSLSRMQIESIFNRSVTDWTRLGLGTVTDAAPGALEATSPIVLCLRNAGSGTKAAFDETLMINATETPVGIPNTVVFSSSTSGVLSCLTANRRSIGYMDADQVVSFTTPTNPNFGLAYVVGVDGAKANDPTLTDPKRDLKCGKYAYWVGWRLNRRTTSEGAAIDALAQAFVDNAALASTISVVPTGAFWVATETMAVFKNSDRGPLLWKTGAHPECR